MPVALTEAKVPEALEHPPRRRWTRAERERLEDLGLLNGERWELIEGELLLKMPKKRPHVQALAILTRWLMSVFADGVNTEAPIDVSPEDNPTSEPEPDLIVLRPDYGDPWSAVPRPADVLLVVEISDTTLEFDATVKAGLYARSGLREYWVVDVQGQRLIVHRNPAGGRWQSIAAYNAGESVSPLAAPGNAFAVGQCFGSR
jgi:Uma2 family endonuclease